MQKASVIKPKPVNTYICSLCWHQTPYRGNIYCLLAQKTWMAISSKTQLSISCRHDTQKKHLCLN